jgi:SPP1 gp7 family putative phage head morphogenesis protein
MSAITTGSGLDKLVPYLTKKYEGDARHAKFVALDQIRKASENVNAARLQSLGVEEYVWMHTGGERYPRKLHMRYSGRTFRYDDPPIIDERTGERGKPGDAINCRCRARPVVNFLKMKERVT